MFNIATHIFQNFVRIGDTYLHLQGIVNNNKTCNGIDYRGREEKYKVATPKTECYRDSLEYKQKIKNEIRNLLSEFFKTNI